MKSSNRHVAVVAFTTLLLLTMSASAQAQVWDFQVKGAKALFSKSPPAVVGTARIVRQPLADGTVSVQESFDLPLKAKQNNNGVGGVVVSVSFAKPDRLIIQRQATEDQQGHLLTFQETIKRDDKVISQTKYQPQSREFVVNYSNFIGRPATKRIPVPQQAYSDTYRRGLLLNPNQQPLGHDQERRVVFAGFHCKPDDIPHAEIVLHRGQNVKNSKEVVREELTCLNVADNSFGTMQRFNNIGNGWCESAGYGHNGALNRMTILWKGYEPIILEYVGTGP